MCQSSKTRGVTKLITKKSTIAIFSSTTDCQSSLCVRDEQVGSCDGFVYTPGDVQ